MRLTQIKYSLRSVPWVLAEKLDRLAGKTIMRSVKSSSTVKSVERTALQLPSHLIDGVAMNRLAGTHS